MSIPEKPILSPFDPSELGEYLRHLRDKEGRQHFVTFLIGAGFSKSAGIPLAGEIAQDLREQAKTHPLLRNAGPKPPDISEYAFLMEKLGSPKERATRVKQYVDRAKDDKGRLKINWSHLLLAALVEKGYVNRLLTTNFDPLIVEALAVTGQPIRTYDLNTTGKYCPGTLDPASVIYLHGQMHSLFLANSRDEMAKLRELYPKVLQEAVQDSILIVLGYSGECDPVLDSLRELPNFPLGLWWSHYSPSGSSPGEGVSQTFEKHGSDCHLATGDDSDTFMRKLVLDGMKLDLPDEVLKPITAIRLALERITPFPKKDIQAADPVQGALEMLRRAESEIEASPETGVNAPSSDAPTSESPRKLARALPIEMAVMVGDWDEFERLRQSVKPNQKSRVSRAVGDGLLKRASEKALGGDPATALDLLQDAARFGVSAPNEPWIQIIWGSALSEQAKLKGATPEADRLFADAGQKFAEALRIKSDSHDALNNWGAALIAQAKLKGATPEADRLFADAGQKFAEALRIKSDKHEALNNWGTALSDQAKLKGATPEADLLFVEAGQKFADALGIKPDKHGALNNWGVALIEQAKLKGATPEADRLFAEAGQKFAEALRLKPDQHETLFNLGCLEALRGNVERCLGHLREWLRYHPSPSKGKLDSDPDFDRVRNDPEFLKFRDALPS